jgi:hypothetical protein
MHEEIVKARFDGMAARDPGEMSLPFIAAFAIRKGGRRRRPELRCIPNIEVRKDWCRDPALKRRRQAERCRIEARAEHLG